MGSLNALGVNRPSLGDADNVPADLNAAVNALSAMSVPSFATTAARDAAKGTADPKVDFNLCRVGSGTTWVYYVWDGDSWEILWSAPRLAEYGRKAATSVPSGSMTDVPLDAATRNVGGWTLSSGALVVPVTGWYKVTARGAWSASTAGRRIIQLVAGSTVLADMAQSPPSNNGFGQNCAGEAFLTAGAAVKLQGLQDSGGALNLNPVRVTLRLTEARITS